MLAAHFCPLEAYVDGRWVKVEPPAVADPMNVDEPMAASMVVRTTAITDVDMNADSDGDIDLATDMDTVTGMAVAADAEPKANMDEDDKIEADYAQVQERLHAMKV